LRPSREPYDNHRPPGRAGGSDIPRCGGRRAGGPSAACAVAWSRCRQCNDPCRTDRTPELATGAHSTVLRCNYSFCICYRTRGCRDTSC
jgi:hypothetical protein